MITTHLAFVRKFGDKAVVVTVLDADQLKDIPDESFVVANTQSSIYSGMNPCITLNKHETFQNEEATRGNSFDGILTSPLWAIRKVKDALLGGLIREEKDTSANGD